MINLSDTTPAPPSGKANIKWQKDPSGLVSGYVDSVGTLTIPGPFADDTAAAAGSVAVGSPYYLSTGFLVVRLVMVLFVALLCAGRASAQTHVNAIANGGTGQSTRQSAFDGLAPSATVAGTIAFYDGSHWVVLAGNASGTKVLQETSSGVPSWVTPSSGTSTIANGTATLGTSAIASNACASVVTVSASGVATTDNIMADFNADPTSTTGYVPGAMLTIVKYPTSNNVNFKVCNNTGSSITPGAETLNWRVVR